MPAAGNSTHAKGRAVERQAAAWLTAQGYLIVARNFRCRLGEIDLIAEHQGHLVFIEVRSRRDARYGQAAAAVSPGKAAQVAKVAAYFIAFHGARWALHPKRFDVVAVTSSSPILLPDAFRLGELSYRHR